MLPRVIILPGNGCTPVHAANWYAAVAKEMTDSGLFSEVVLRDMPDPFEAKETIWIPFIQNEMKCDENTIVIGHSSGAEAAMRLLERQHVLGCVLVSACHSDLGLESERISGYYSRPWQWDSIRGNAKFILQYHSTDDPFIPREQADLVAHEIGSDYTCFEDRSHFFTYKSMRNLLPDLRAKLNT